MVNPPAHTILVVGNRGTGKTSYINRVLNIPIIHDAYCCFASKPITLYYAPATDSTPSIRIIELNHVGNLYTRIPFEYRYLIDKIIIVAAHGDNDSINNIDYHTYLYQHMNVPIEIIVNKRDLLGTSLPISYPHYTMSCKYDRSVVDLMVNAWNRQIIQNTPLHS